MKISLKSEYVQFRALLLKLPSPVLAVLVVSVVSMNLLANKELFHTSWVALDCGFVLSWIPFLIMDALCKVYGGKAAAEISVFAILVNLVFFAIFKLVSLTPGMWGAYYSTGMPEVNDALNRTVGGSSWIVLGSALAMTVSSVVNSLVNVAVGRFFVGGTGDGASSAGGSGRGAGVPASGGFGQGTSVPASGGYGQFAARSFTSTAVSQFVDNLVFALVVSLPLFGWSMRQVLFCSLTAAGFELLLEVCFSGIGYRLTKSLPKEQVGSGRAG